MIFERHQNTQTTNRRNTRPTRRPENHGSLQVSSFGRTLSASLLIVCALIAPLIIVGSHQAYAQQPIQADFSIQNIWVAPSTPTVGDLVVFYGNVLLQAKSDLRPPDMIDVQGKSMSVPLSAGLNTSVRCFLDDHLLWDGSLIFSETRAQMVYTEAPWHATQGRHTVRWVVDQDLMYGDPDRDNNIMQYQFEVGDTPRETDFSISATPNLQVKKIGEPISYHVDVYMTATQEVHLILERSPPGFKPTFSPASLNSTHSSILSLLWSAALAGTYHLNITALGEKHNRSLTITLVLQPLSKGSSFISILASPQSLNSGNNVTIRGAISPPRKAPVILRYTRPEGINITINLESASDGTFAYTIKADTPGSWVFSVIWLGDTEYGGAMSNSVRIAVGQEASPGERLFEIVRNAPSETLDFVTVALLAVLIAALLFASIALRRRD
jgi:hypothetical protein